jgi:hypothetical protein
MLYVHTSSESLKRAADEIKEQKYLIYESLLKIIEVETKVNR